ncbi:MAG: hypothetical protein A4E65_00026 [Syntrophorhabdus sp. PtaU1.Bin153]|nr:MAG: hypothetical protein A4E65_00026 [Syntrophorhabdus sp. PtaU1.Bin153]
MVRKNGPHPVVLNCRVLIVGIMLCFVAASIVGCVTTGQVEEIVAKSNESMLPGASLPGAETAGPLAGRWQEDAARIDAFIAAHPGREVLASALRVRQAMLFLGYEQYNLANASFEMVNPQHLYTARDRALYELRGHLIWWFRQARAPFSGDDFQRGSEALLALQKRIDFLEDSPDTRDYLAEMRAYIALQMARRHPNLSERTRYFGEGMNQYAKIFTREDLALLLGHQRDQKELLKNRRQIRALAVIKTANGLIKETPEILNVVNNADFRTLLK